jgi:hypothetical protein
MFRKFNIFPHARKCYRYCHLLGTTKKIFKQTYVHNTDITFIFHILTSVKVNKTGHVGTNITLMCVCITTVTMEKKYYIFWLRVCTRSNAACKGCGLYNIVIWGLLNFLQRFKKINHIPNFMKIRSVGAKLYHAERQMGTGMDGQTWWS